MSKWEETQIKDFGRVITGFTPPTQDLKLWQGNIPFYSPADFRDGVYCLETERTVNLKALANDRIVQENSLMVTCIASIGKIALAQKTGISNQQINTINFNEKFDPYYGYYLIKFNLNKLLRLSGSTTIPIVNKTDFENILIKHHSDIKEQQKIARILSTADTVIEKTQDAIAKYKAIKQGMLHDLFTRGIDTQTGKLRPKKEDAPDLYKESELGWIPKEWSEGKLSDYFKLLKSGLSRLLSEQDIGLPVLISGNIQNNKIDFSSLRYWFKKDPQGADTDNFILDPGDILLCFINSVDQIGKVAIYEGFIRDCIYTTNLFRIKASEKTNSKFLYYLLCSEVVQNEIKVIVKPAVNQASFTTKDFSKIPVPIIPTNEQELIKVKFEQIDSLIYNEQNYLQKLQQIKSGLMADLLSGKKLVSVPNELTTETSK